MSPSFLIKKAPIYRVFSITESSAIREIEIDGNYVEITFHSDHEKAYLYEGTDKAIAELSEMIKSPDLLGKSLGKVRAKLCKSEDLKNIEMGGY